MNRKLTLAVLLAAGLVVREGMAEQAPAFEDDETAALERDLEEMRVRHLANHVARMGVAYGAARFFSFCPQARTHHEELMRTTRRLSLRVAQLAPQAADIHTIFSNFADRAEAELLALPNRDACATAANRLNTAIQELDSVARNDAERRQSVLGARP